MVFGLKICGGTENGGEDEMKRLNLFFGFLIIVFSLDKSLHKSMIQNTAYEKTWYLYTDILEKIKEPNETNCEIIYMPRVVFNIFFQS